MNASRPRERHGSAPVGEPTMAVARGDRPARPHPGDEERAHGRSPGADGDGRDEPCREQRTALLTNDAAAPLMMRPDPPDENTINANASTTRRTVPCREDSGPCSTLPSSQASP